ncbi:MAG: SHOCT-like domain-containing protein [Omnitrophica WOR_2 bacterium]
MATNEERMKILKMIQEGKITAEEGAKLLAALRESRKPTTGRPGVSLGGNKGWLRVRVTDMTSGRTKVNVNLPLGLMDAGLRIGAQYAPELQDMDLEQLMSELKSGTTSGKIIDVIDEEDGEHVEIFIE